LNKPLHLHLHAMAATGKNLGEGLLPGGCRVRWEEGR